MDEILYDTHEAHPGDLPLSVHAQWYEADEPLTDKPPELLIDLGMLTTTHPRVIAQQVFDFLIDNGLETSIANKVADKVVMALPYLHSSTLGLVVRSMGQGHWQVIAERGQ